MKLKILFTPFAIALFTIQLHAQSPKVRYTGAMNAMGNIYEFNIWLDSIPNKSHLFGMGPYDKMKGEITVVDGTPYFATAFVEGIYEVGESWDIRAPFFVYAHVDQWKSFKLKGNFKTVNDIQDAVSKIARANGYDTSQPFPFKIKGTFDVLTAHIVTPRNPEVEGFREGVKSQKFSFERSKGEMIGFYSEHHQGIYTHHDSFVHVHFLTKDKSFMGHLDDIDTYNGTFKLFLPKND
ncbi:acetolactate decarboxylase [Flagellimonas beolgyonensis]|uniref:acetolactate decarboxylase n=1 Tax=Flagellimonas beolgyonensis TaxID=864064 RepID=UPI003D647F22